MSRPGKKTIIIEAPKPLAERLERLAKANDRAWQALSIALAWGFWTLQPWAWPLGVVLQGANIILAIVQFLTADTGIVSTIISVGIAGVILYYLNQPTIKSLFGRA